MEPRERWGGTSCGNLVVEPCDPRDGRGVALIDLVFTCALILVLAAIAIPTLQVSRERDAARMAARHLAHKFQLLRVEAVRRNRTVAMRFDPDDLGHVATFVDGDGDGVLQSDIDRGIDTPLDAATHLRGFFAGVELRVASTMPMPDGTGVIAADSDPVRIGNTNLVSFSPLGSSTSGTIYLSARDGSQMCVRLLGSTGRVRVLWFDRASATWRPE
jgi:Tfp pilus assembly protein FimT